MTAAADQVGKGTLGFYEYFNFENLKENAIAFYEDLTLNQTVALAAGSALTAYGLVDLCRTRSLKGAVSLAGGAVLLGITYATLNTLASNNIPTVGGQY